eukprot:scaffold2551_cov113-Cylindrotheca_fusiformis.AAC.3
MPSFPYTLHQLLEEVEENAELSAIISWLPDGKSFRMHSPPLFEKMLLQTYYPRQSQLKSFMRQLQYYGFDNFGDGLFSHPKFQRGQRALCGQITHMIPTKNQKSTGKVTTRPAKTRGRKKKRVADSMIRSTTKHRLSNNDAPSLQQQLRVASLSPIRHRHSNNDVPSLQQQLRLANLISQQQLFAAQANWRSISFRDELFFLGSLFPRPSSTTRYLGNPAV